jgi:hypothetical protein
MIKRFSVICFSILFIGLMGKFTVAQGSPGYRADVLEQGNAGGWEQSSKTFDDKWTIAQSETVTVDIWIHDIPEPLITAGFFIEFDASSAQIERVEIYDGGNDPWDSGMTSVVADPSGPGSYLVTVGDLSSIVPDSESDIIIAQVLFQSTSPDDASITIKPVPGFDTVVGDSAGVYDSEIVPHTITLHPTGGVTPDCDDGIACTVDSSGPDDQCSNIPDDRLCDDGLFCNGTETCDPSSGCRPANDPCDTPGECDEETDECISPDDPIPPEGDLPLSFRLIPQAHLRSHWIPLPLFMFIVSEDEETRFDNTTTVALSDEDIVTSPVTLVLSEKLVYVFSLIRTAGLGSGGITEVDANVATAEGEGTEMLNIITLPFF